MENNTNKTNKNLIIGVMTCVILLLIAALVYFLFIKKDKFEDKGQVLINDISIKKNLEVFAFNILLDTNGNAYLDLRENNINNENNPELTNLFNKADTYKYNEKTEKLIKLNVKNVKDIQTFDFGNGGGKYIILLDNNDK